MAKAFRGFPYVNGKKKTVGDPIRIGMRFAKCGPQLDALLAKLKETPSDEAALDAVYQCLLTVFDLKPYSLNDAGEEEGTTIGEAIAILDSFMAWQEELKNEQGLMLKSLNSMGHQPSSSPNGSKSGSGSTGIERGSAGRSRSSKQLRQHSPATKS